MSEQAEAEKDEGGRRKAEESKVPRVMVDLETWGTRPGSVIVSLAAVRFDDAGMKHVAPFHRVIDARSCLAAGLKVDAETLYWWMAQPEQARFAMMGIPGAGSGAIGRAPLHSVLMAFRSWLPIGPDWELWCNGANFDEPMLVAAFDAIDWREAPWKHSQVRCFRTLKKLLGGRQPEPTREGVHHNALDDAMHQARWARRMLDFVPTEP